MDGSIYPLIRPFCQDGGVVKVSTYFEPSPFRGFLSREEQLVFSGILAGGMLVLSGGVREVVLGHHRGTDPAPFGHWVGTIGLWYSKGRMPGPASDISHHHPRARGTGSAVPSGRGGRDEEEAHCLPEGPRSPAAGLQRDAGPAGVQAAHRGDSAARPRRMRGGGDLPRRPRIGIMGTGPEGPVPPFFWRR